MEHPPKPPTLCPCVVPLYPTFFALFWIRTGGLEYASKRNGKFEKTGNIERVMWKLYIWSYQKISPCASIPFENCVFTNIKPCCSGFISPNNRSTARMAERQDSAHLLQQNFPPINPFAAMLMAQNQRMFGCPTMLHQPPPHFPFPQHAPNGMFTSNGYFFTLLCKRVHRTDRKRLRESYKVESTSLSPPANTKFKSHPKVYPFCNSPMSSFPGCNRPYSAQYAFMYIMCIELRKNMCPCNIENDP